jgi:hypothetical protein
LGQWTDGLLVEHDSADQQNKVKRAKFDVDHAFQQDKLLLLTVTSGPKGTTVYLNARKSQLFSMFEISQSELSGQLVMGTSAVEYQPWSGEVSGLAIYSKELSAAEVSQHYRNWVIARGVDPPDLEAVIARYAFTEHAGREIHNAVALGPALEIPKFFGIPHKALLTSPLKEFGANWRYFTDVMFNIAGFVPLGFILCCYLLLTRTRWNAIVTAVVAGGILSFVIEILQAYIPRRVSGITDIITNTLGTALGAVLARPSIVRAILKIAKLLTMRGKSVSQQN